MSPVWLQQRNGLLYWGSLVASVLVAVAFLRYQPPRGQACFSSLEEVAPREQRHALRIPFEVAADEDAEVSTLTVRGQFSYAAIPEKPQAIFLESAAPQFRASLNGVDLTPDVQLSRRDLRSRAPKLIPFAGVLLRKGRNTLVLEFPLDASVGTTRLQALCVADYAVLQQVYQANWWRQVGIGRVCLLLLLIMAMLAVGLRLLGDVAAVWHWYLALLALMSMPIAWQAIDWKPAGVIVHRVISDTSFGAVLWVLSMLISRLWNAPMPRLQRCVAWCVAGVALIWESRALLGYELSALFNAVSLIQVACAIAILWACRSQIRERFFRRELQVISWAIFFGAGCSTVEIVVLMASGDWHLVPAYAIAAVAVATSLMFVLARRVVLGVRVLRYSHSVLGMEPQLALDRTEASAERLLGAILGRGATDERQRLLRDIHDGFGSRLVGVLGALRRGGAGSELFYGVHRALLDMRIMIDALDDSVDTLDVALAALRHRAEPMLDAAGIASVWRFHQIGSVKIVDRRRLLHLLRCVEEILSNAIQHSHATTVVFEGRADEGRLAITVSDNGCGLSVPQVRGQGLRNIDFRVLALGGTWTAGPGPNASGTQIELTLPYI